MFNEDRKSTVSKDSMDEILAEISSFQIDEDTRQEDGENSKHEYSLEEILAEISSFQIDEDTRQEDGENSKPEYSLEEILAEVASFQSNENGLASELSDSEAENGQPGGKLKQTGQLEKSTGRRLKQPGRRAAKGHPAAKSGEAPANSLCKDLFPTPFSKKYWYLAASEMKSTRMLVLAAVITALRVGVKAFSIPIAANLSITFGFLFNSVGSMIYGPVMAILASAVSDTLGAIIFPSGTYFFPFIFVEIAGGLLFALFFYRAQITGLRVILARFSVTLVCNIILNPLIMIPYYTLYMGKAYNFLSLPRMIKNLALFPLEALILVVLFNAILPVTNRMGLTFTGNTKLKLNKKEIITLIVLTVVSALAIVVYCLIVDLI